MAYFDELDKVINKIISVLISDQELCKLLYYNDSNPISQPDIANTRSLLFNKIFPLSKQPDAQTTAATILDISFLSGKPWVQNSGYKKEIICFDILCHLDLWKIDGGLRPNEISKRIDCLFNNKHFSDISMNNIYFDSWVNMNYSNYFYGYRLGYVITNNSNI